MKPDSKFPVADLYACWNKQAIYLGLYAQDVFETDYYRNKIIPEVDRAEWSVSQLARTAKQFMPGLAPRGPPVCDEPALHGIGLSGAYYSNTRNIAAIELPAKTVRQNGIQTRRHG